MKVELWAIGKTSEKYLQAGIDIYDKRLRNYLPFSFVILPDVKIKTTDGARLKQEEGKMVLDKIAPDDYLVLLDEQGRRREAGVENPAPADQPAAPGPAGPQPGPKPAPSLPPPAAPPPAQPPQQKNDDIQHSDSSGGP